MPTKQDPLLFFLSLVCLEMKQIPCVLSWRLWTDGDDWSTGPVFRVGHHSCQQWIYYPNPPKLLEEWETKRQLTSCLQSCSVFCEPKNVDLCWWYTCFTIILYIWGLWAFLFTGSVAFSLSVSLSSYIHIYTYMYIYMHNYLIFSLSEEKVDFEYSV